jgi:hypothetical protein
MAARQFTFPDFKWWLGVVEGVDDEKQFGRLQVRIYGYHPDDKSKVPSDKLAWAVVSNGIQSSSLSGLGHSPTGIVKGASVWGFFLDGEGAQAPIIVGSLPGEPDKGDAGKGFSDPDGVYPNKPGESDVNRLSRGKTNETVVEKTRSSLDTASTAFGGSWTEPSSPFGAKYPFNHVHESISGHVYEIDDTPGKERLSRHHRQGSFEEIGPDGTRVHKVVKDNYEVVLGNDFIVVRGNCQITVDGNASVLVGGNCDMEVMGNMKEHIAGNYELQVDGSAKWNVDGDWARSSGTHISDDAPAIDHN